MIKDVISDLSEVLLFTRPRRFGKSLNMSMLYHFLSNQEDSSKLFNKLSIGNEKDIIDNHLNKYLVIFMSFKDVKGDDFEEVLGIIFKDVTTSDYQQEGHYQNLFVGLMVMFRHRYVTYQSVKNHMGVADVVIRAVDSKDTSILIEFKQGKDLESKVEEALKQIEVNEYYSIFEKDGISNYICYGIAANTSGVRVKRFKRN